MQFQDDVDVKLVDLMGSDLSIVAAARVSTIGEGSLGELDRLMEARDEGLIGYLMRNRHGTPFEHAAMTFFIHAPIFCFREYHRHRIGWSYNEESARYRQLDDVFYLPGENRGGEMQKEGGKPGQYEYYDATPAELKVIQYELTMAYQEAWSRYTNLLERGVAKEVARMCLPVGIFSTMYATCNPRSLMAFLSLRTKRHEWDPHLEDNTGHAKFPSKPQKEINMIADKLEAAFRQHFPVTWRAFEANGRVAP